MSFERAFALTALRASTHDTRTASRDAPFEWAACGAHSLWVPPRWCDRREPRGGPDGADSGGFDLQTLRTTIEVALRRYELEMRLALSERLAAIGALAAGLAHEINNPLTAVIGNLGFALEHVTHSARLMAEIASGRRTTAGLTALAEAREALDDALQSAERVAKIIQDLRRFSRTTGEPDQLLEVREVLDLALRLAGGIVKQSARFRCLEGSAPTVRGNEGRLTQVLTNLLVNAVQAVDELPHHDGEITVVTTTDVRGWAVVEVRDTGPGMSAEVLARAFDPFFTTKPIGTGMGLGLSLAHTMVTAMGGELTARSELGRGSTFRVALPPAAPAGGETARPAGGHDGAQRTDPLARVVVLDDEEPVGEAVARMLRKGYQVTTVTTPSALLARVKAGERWDVLLCDVMLPEIDGSEVHARLAAIDPELAHHTVFISGGVLDPRVEARLAALPNALLLKPFTLSQLRDAVKAAAKV